ncbi:cyclase family protein [Saccharothrix syringae]|uniref:Cyclase family protein n=1 Tax=Saccharothrix syringae TaxID=103733 RepID=A0A5Q0H4X0_SACSY|nr:cyclase family protein [Saccharothrix syringae]QFZ21199.1 cyclase family protein [Saccharothrix syringae]
MSALTGLMAALRTGAVEVVDLTAPLSEQTPIIALPPERGQPWPFSREVISDFDVAGPTVYWNNIRLSEHTGTHFDAPAHWLSGKGGPDVSEVPPADLVGPAVVLDFSAEAAADPDFLLRREHVERWQDEHGPLPDRGWLLYRTGWDARGNDPARFLNDGHTPGVDPDCARWLAERTPVIGIGVETVGTDAGLAGGFERPYPCHWFFHGAGKYGLTQLRNLARLPTTGAVLVASPLPIVRGSGSPTRVLALVDRRP